MSKREEGKRFNTGKPRYELVPAHAQDEYVKVLTKGAEKYGDHNWKLGMKWSTVIGSLERHLYAIKRGEDYDPETGLLHSAHIMCNAAFLTEYYKIHPQRDDRVLFDKYPKRIGLDIDGVLANFKKRYVEHYGIENAPDIWVFDPLMKERLEELATNDEFWLSIEPLTDPTTIPFEPYCYITARPCESDVSAAWLRKHKFPVKPVYTVRPDQCKAETAKQLDLDWFVDDKYSHYVALNKAGVCCFLWDSPSNRHFSVGHKRISSFHDLRK